MPFNIIISPMDVEKASLVPIIDPIYLLSLFPDPSVPLYPKGKLGTPLPSSPPKKMRMGKLLGSLPSLFDDDFVILSLLLLLLRLICLLPNQTPLLLLFLTLSVTPTFPLRLGLSWKEEERGGEKSQTDWVLYIFFFSRFSLYFPAHLLSLHKKGSQFLEIWTISHKRKKFYITLHNSGRFSPPVGEAPSAESREKRVGIEGGGFEMIPFLFFVPLPPFR